MWVLDNLILIHNRFW